MNCIRDKEAKYIHKEPQQPQQEFMSFLKLLC